MRGAAPGQADGGGNDLALLNLDGGPNFSGAGVEATGEGKALCDRLKLGGKGQEMSQAIANSAGMCKVKSVLDFAVNRIAGAGDDGGVKRSLDLDFVGARSVKAKTTMSLEVATPNLSGIEDRGGLVEVDGERDYKGCGARGRGLGGGGSRMAKKSKSDENE